MTDDFDVSLRRRLESLASAVPVAQSGEITAVVRRPVRARFTSRLALTGLFPVLAVVVIVVVLTSVAQIGPGPGDSSVRSSNAADGPIEATTRSGNFELTIRSARGRYAVGEPIDIEAALTYVIDELPGGVQIGHALGADDGPLGFGIEEPVIGELRLTPGTRDACARTMLVPGEPLSTAFVKSAGWSGDDPSSDDYRAFVLDPVLQLGVGTWHVYAVASFSLGDCGPDSIEMRADLTIEVDAQAAIESPTARPPDQTGISLLTAPEPEKGCLTQYNEGRLVRDPVTGLGIFVPRFAIGVVWPFGYSAREEAGIAVLVGPDGQAVARESELVGFSGPGPGEDELIHACGDVRVVEADPTSDPAVDGIQAIDEDGTFRLELRSSKSVYMAGEPLDIDATLAHIGSEQAGDFHGGILFSGTQTDGTHAFFPGPMVDVCVPRAIQDLPDELALADWPKVRSLPAGTWRISASFSGSAPACTGGGSSLSASIDLTVVDADEATRSIPLLTAADVDEVSSDRFCRNDTPFGLGGELALDATSGLGLASENGDIQPIRWPPGFTAEVLPDGAILYAEGGQIVAREGDPMSFPAGIASDGVMSVCGQFLFW